LPSSLFSFFPYSSPFSHIIRQKREEEEAEAEEATVRRLWNFIHASRPFLLDEKRKRKIKNKLLSAGCAVVVMAFCLLLRRPFLTLSLFPSETNATNKHKTHIKIGRRNRVAPRRCVKSPKRLGLRLLGRFYWELASKETEYPTAIIWFMAGGLWPF
jgi:hypothetical protein